jgi:hypothetical protein
MHMIRHYDKHVQFHMRKMFRDGHPETLGHCAHRIQDHRVVGDVPEQHLTFIRAVLGVVVALQTR